MVPSASYPVRCHAMMDSGCTARRRRQSSVTNECAKRHHAADSQTYQRVVCHFALIERLGSIRHMERVVVRGQVCRRDDRAPEHARGAGKQLGLQIASQNGLQAARDAALLGRRVGRPVENSAVNHRGAATDALSWRRQRRSRDAMHAVRRRQAGSRLAARKFRQRCSRDRVLIQRLRHGLAPAAGVTQVLLPYRWTLGRVLLILEQAWQP